MNQKVDEARIFCHIRTAMRVLRWLVIAVLAVVAALLIRLHIAPLPIDFLKPFVRNVLVFDNTGVRLDFDDGVLAWGRADSLRNDWSFLELDLTGLRLVDGKGHALLTLPRGRVRLSGVALLAGRVAPAALEVEGLELRLNWSGGDLVSALGRIDNEAAGVSSPAALVLGLLAPPVRGQAAGYLQQVKIINARVLLEESLSDSRWQLSDATLRVSRGGNSMLLSATGMLSRQGARITRLDLAGVYNAKSGTSHVELLFEKLNPANIAGDSEALAALKAVDMPLSGSVGATFKGGRQLQAVNFDLSGDAGFITIPKFYDGPLSFDGALARGHYDITRRQAVFDSLRLKFVGATVEGDGIAFEEEDGLGLRFFATVSNLPFQWLKAYWPEGIGDGAHNWISRNLTAGRISHGEMHLDIEPGMWKAGALPPDALDFSFVYDGATAHYLRPMPPILGGRGHARLDAHRFELWLDGGNADGVAVAGSHIIFDDIHLGGAKSKTIVDARLKGGIRAVLTLIDYPPLGFPTRYGLDPRSVDGTANIKLALAFPPVRSLTLSDVAFKVQAQLSPLHVQNLFGSVGITDGNLGLEADDSGIVAKGKIALNDVPFDLVWHEDFKTKAKYPTRFELDGALSGKDWEVFSLPFADYVSGPGTLHLILEGKGPAIRQGNGTVDFQDAGLGFDELGWRKPPGEPAGARFRFVERASGALEIPDVVYEDNKMRASGAFVIADEGLQQMVIDDLKIGDTHLAATITRDPKMDFIIAVTAESFDARPFIEKTFTGGGTEGDYSMPSFSLDIFASKVLGLNNVVLGNLQVNATYRNDRWDSTNFVGNLTGGGTLKFELVAPKATDGAPSRRSFSLTSNDAGEVARALGLFENGVGGKLSFTGSLSAPGTDQDVTGKVCVDDFRVVTAPTLSQILGAGSLAGIRNLLAGDGIGFKRLEVPYSFRNGVITLKGARARGPAIGLTMSGELDIKNNVANLKGSIVPAYTANSILGKIPVLGKLLIGGKGEGLFAIDYEVSGPLDKPDVSVNPLTMLTPGFLRGIFGAF